MKTRVLIVDDEEEFVQALSERLAARHYNVSTSLSGEEAVRKVKDVEYDVVILDVLMPGMDGLETLSEIKKIRPLTEVIMLTGHVTVESALEGMKLGAFDYLLKPYETEELHAKIKKAYEKKAENEARIRAAEVRK